MNAIVTDVWLISEFCSAILRSLELLQVTRALRTVSWSSSGLVHVVVGNFWLLTTQALVICMSCHIWLFRNCVQNNDVELLAGYLSLHQDGDQLSVKWTPNQLMNGCSADVDEPLPTKRYRTSNQIKSSLRDACWRSMSAEMKSRMRFCQQC